MYDDTIAAISTAPGDGAISIIRMSGPESIAIADRLLNIDLFSKASHTISYGTVLEKGKPVDEVLVSVFKAPRTYTREDLVEINSHGGIYVTQKILRLLLKEGARLARPGEFTERAFLNGRIDLSQAEAVEEMIEADSDSALSLAVSNLKGGVRSLIEPLIDELTGLIAHLEVNIDYPEYDLEQLQTRQLIPRAESLMEKMDVILKEASRTMMIAHGIRTVIAGRPNVGKSSLLNALLDEEKAIVTDIEGTTRDLVEGRIRIGSVQLNLIDTAGIREANDQIEQIGIQKSQQALEQADLVLLVLDGTRELQEDDLELLKSTENKQRILVINKSDLSEPVFELEDSVQISASQRDLKELYTKLETLFSAPDFTQNHSLSSLRQISLLEKARLDMMRALEAMETGIEPDLVEIDLLAALDHLKEIIGTASRDDLLDTLFSNFCLGK